MKQTNSNWQNKREVKRGNIGEEIVINYIESLGKLVYTLNSSERHFFDTIVVTPQRYIDEQINKEIFAPGKIEILEIKTKPSRYAYPDTGFNYDQYVKYKYLNDILNIPLSVWFVDPLIGNIYGGNLTSLEQQTSVANSYGKKISYPLKQYSKEGKEIIYFPIDNMKIIATLTKEQIEEINKTSLPNYSSESDQTGMPATL